MTTYYRIHFGQITEADLHEQHVSRFWCGEDDAERRGLSACRSYDALVAYFCGAPWDGTSVARGATFRNAYLVLLEGVESGDEPFESDEALIHPTAIISQEPATGRFLADLLALCQSVWCRNGERAVYDAARDEVKVVDDEDEEMT